MSPMSIAVGAGLLSPPLPVYYLGSGPHGDLLLEAFANSQLGDRWWNAKERVSGYVYLWSFVYLVQVLIVAAYRISIYTKMNI